LFGTDNNPHQKNGEAGVEIERTVEKVYHKIDKLYGENVMEVWSTQRSANFGREDSSSISVLLPVYNEAGIISNILTAYYNEICRKVSGVLVVAEDGSTDGTKEVLASLQSELPIVLHSGPRRKGYAKAAIDALKSCNGDWVFFSDSDGQYSPADFWKLWKKRDHFDMIIGRKVHRSEGAHRIVLSKGFHKLVNGTFGLNLHDADCGFRLIRKEVIRSVINKVRFLDYSFWAEFTVRASLEGFRICEEPINHASRTRGGTQIYKPSKIALIVLKQLEGLAHLYVDVRGGH
jgi:glycosyltransferase involved in cell wall biosynthesis